MSSVTAANLSAAAIAYRESLPYVGNCAMVGDTPPSLPGFVGESDKVAMSERDSRQSVAAAIAWPRGRPGQAGV